MTVGMRRFKANADAQPKAACNVLLKVAAGVPANTWPSVYGPVLGTPIPCGGSEAHDVDCAGLPERGSRGCKIAIGHADGRGSETRRVSSPSMVGDVAWASVPMAWCELRHDFRTDRTTGIDYLEVGHPAFPVELRRHWRPVVDRGRKAVSAPCPSGPAA